MKNIIANPIPGKLSDSCPTICDLIKIILR
jgi:hypothetical protein